MCGLSSKWIVPVILQNSFENVHTFNEKYDFLSVFLLINEGHNALVPPSCNVASSLNSSPLYTRRLRFFFHAGLEEEWLKAGSSYRGVADYYTRIPLNLTPRYGHDTSRRYGH